MKGRYVHRPWCVELFVGKVQDERRRTNCNGRHRAGERRTPAHDIGEQEQEQERPEKGEGMERESHHQQVTAPDDEGVKGATPTTAGRNREEEERPAENGRKMCGRCVAGGGRGSPFCVTVKAPHGLSATVFCKALLELLPNAIARDTASESNSAFFGAAANHRRDLTVAAAGPAAAAHTDRTLAARTLLQGELVVVVVVVVWCRRDERAE
jgi:hypothetical protein